jgi:hypothetical protein
MVELVAIVEGETEQIFVRNQLAAHLGYRDIAMWAVLPGKSRRRAGVKPWEVASADIMRTLKEKRYCTTMFDYYAMPESWPGRVSSKSVPWHDKARHVEQALAADISEKLGDKFDSRRFIPYIQLHEFEALAFAGPRQLAAVTAPVARSDPGYLQRHFESILEKAVHPEAINDSYETCPSRRIASVVRAYRKPLHGTIVVDRIGLEVLRAKCSHFAGWLDRLESLRSEN